MFDPTKRNRNIGTPKQGHGKNNKMVIPWPASVMKSFTERLTDYEKVYREIHGNFFVFVIEKTRKDCFHACTVNDVVEIIRHIKPSDYGGLKLIVLRQPKRKEEIISPVWGRFIYSYEFEEEHQPAVILEAMDYTRTLKWSKSLQPDSQKELDRLREDGHEVITDRRYHHIKYTLDTVRNTQLYRTLPHEFGHWKHFLEEVGDFDKLLKAAMAQEKDALIEAYDKREEKYFRMHVDEKEKYAHAYAYELKKMLEQSRMIPFDRIEDEEQTNS